MHCPKCGKYNKNNNYCVSCGYNLGQIKNKKIKILALIFIIFNIFLWILKWLLVFLVIVVFISVVKGLGY